MINKIIKWLNDDIVTKYDFIKEIWIYGSYARNEQNIYSDIDLMLCIPGNYFNKENILNIRRETPGYQFPDIDFHFCIDSVYNKIYDKDIFIKNVRMEGKKILEKKTITNSQKMIITE